MKKIIWKQIISIMLIFGLSITSVLAVGDSVGATLKPKSIRLSDKKKTLYQGECYTLRVKGVLPKKSSKSVRWKSDKNRVATVSRKGMITAKKPGKAKISAISTINQKIKATCKVTVKKGLANKSITLNQKKAELTINQSITLSVSKWNPKNTKVKKVTWSTSDKKVVRVSNRGIVTAVAEGTAMIRATNTYNKTAVCVVSVTLQGTISTNKPTVNPTQPPMVTNPSVSTQTPIPTQTTAPTPLSGVIMDWQTPSNFESFRADVTYGEMKTIEYYSTTTEKNRKCNILLPRNYSEEKQYPVLYLLHGIGGDQNEWLGGNPKNIIGNLIEDGEAEEMVVVIPNVRARANDAADGSLGQENVAAFDNFIHDLRDNLMPYIEENYSVSTKREHTAIAGLSMGARESLFIGFSMPERFNYIGSFSAAPGLLPAADVDYENQFPGQFQPDEFTIPDDKTPPHVILLCVGTEDWLFEYSKQYHDTLLSNNVAHLWYTMPGVHDFGVWKNGLYQFVKRIFK